MKYPNGYLFPLEFDGFVEEHYIKGTVSLEEAAIEMRGAVGWEKVSAVEYTFGRWVPGRHKGTQHLLTRVRPGRGAFPITQVFP